MADLVERLDQCRAVEWRRLVRHRGRASSSAAMASMSTASGPNAKRIVRAQATTCSSRLPDHDGVRIGVGTAVPELAAVVSAVRHARLAARGGLLDPDRYGSVTAWDDLGLDRLLLRVGPVGALDRGPLQPVVGQIQVAGARRPNPSHDSFLRNWSRVRRSAPGTV